MGRLRKIAVSAALLLVGIAVGARMERPVQRSPKPTVDLGAGISVYVPSGKLELLDNAGVNLADIWTDLGSYNRLQIEFSNGRNGPLGVFRDGSEVSFLTMYGQFDSMNTKMVEITARPDLRIQSDGPEQSAQFSIGSFKFPRFSFAWWKGVFGLFKDPKRASLAQELPSEDVRLVKRDGTPFAVCGHGITGEPTLAFVSSSLAPEEILSFEPSAGSLYSMEFAIYGGFLYGMTDQVVADFTTQPDRGPRIYLAGPDKLVDSGLSLGYTLDPTGDKIVPVRSLMSPGPTDGVIPWLARPMYKAVLPIRLVDANGKLLWSSAGTIQR